MKALVAQSPGELAVEDVVLPDVGTRSVRVAVRAAGVCHSDLSMVNGTFAPSFPLVLGHEAAGVVVEVGADVSRVRVGDAVVLNWQPACRECWFCRAGEPWLCVKGGAPSVPRGALADGTPLHVTLGLGSLAEQVVVPGTAVIVVPAELPAEIAALLGCAVVTGFGAVRHTAGVVPGHAVAVVGLGGVGLSVVAAAQAAGADPVVAIDVSTSKRELALSMGATHFLESGDGLSARVRTLTDGRGVDHAFECVGRAAAIRTTWKITRRGGQCTIVGIGSRDEAVTFSAAELFHHARTLRSSVFGSADAQVDVPLLADQIVGGRLELSPLTTRRVGIGEAATAFDLMRLGEGARTVVTFEP